jgi:predicted aminopeptidase
MIISEDSNRLNKPGKSRFQGKIVIILALIFICSGCRLAYVFHAAAGQFRLLHNSIPMKEALEDDSLENDQKARLRLVAQIKDFGEKELGLKKTRNYETVYLKSPQAPVYMVSASPKDRLDRITWWFPVVGDMPYLGFFDLNKAKAEKEKLLKKDLDVIMGRADAYSTLGWFKDPVTLNLVTGSTVDLVETILHEMTHTTLYVKGQGEFNEGLAVLVGKVGAFLFFKKTVGPTHPLTLKAQESIEDERLFSPFLKALLEKLKHLYDSPVNYQAKLMEREKIFARSLEEFNSLKNSLHTDHFTRFGTVKLNNAYLMTVGLYHENFRFFESVLEKNGNSIRETLIFFKDLAREEGDMMKRTRDWLG